MPLPISLSRNLIPDLSIRSTAVVEVEESEVVVRDHDRLVRDRVLELELEVRPSALVHTKRAKLAVAAVPLAPSFIPVERTHLFAR